jgi:Tfp pilus assembly protein PilF
MKEEIDMSNLIRIIVIISLCSLVFSPNINSQSSSELVQTGLSSYQSGDYESALNSFNNALQVSGSDVDSDLPLTGESQMEYTGESKEVDDSESQMEYTGESKETYTGESQMQTADVSNIQEYSDPLNYQGDDPADLYLYRGQTYLKLGDKEAALNDFDKAISLDSSYADAYFRRAIINYQVDPDKACPDLQTAINEGHESAQELFNLICKQ